MRKVGIYLRVSTDRQVRDGQSLEFQERLLKEHIANHPDMVLVDEYIDDGISGTKFDQRDELQRLLGDVKEGKIDLILFTRLDRFFRSVRHLMNTLDFLEKHGCEWEAIQEYHDNSPTGKLSITIMSAFAQLEADMDSARIRDSFQNKRAKKEWLNGSVPYGYVYKDKHAVPDPEKADIVRRMYADYIRHGNLSQLIRDYLPYDCPHSHDGTKKLLTNRAYIGEKDGISDYLVPIIDRETFERVQRMRGINVKSSQKEVYIFSGLVICPVCGRKMGGVHKNGKWLSYRCNHTRVQRCTYSHSHSEKGIEDYLLNTYRKDLEERYLHLVGVKKTDNSQKINSIHRKMDRLKDLYVNELIDIRTYREDLDKYKAELNALETPQEAHTEQIEELLNLNVYEIYKTLTKAQKRRLWRAVIKSITPKDGYFFVDYL